MGEKEEEEREEGEEGEMPILDDGEVETEGLIRKYQRNAKPIQSTINCWNSMEEKIRGRMKDICVLCPNIFVKL